MSDRIKNKLAVSMAIVPLYDTSVKSQNTELHSEAFDGSAVADCADNEGAVLRGLDQPTGRLDQPKKRGSVSWAEGVTSPMPTRERRHRAKIDAARRAEEERAACEEAHPELKDRWISDFFAYEYGRIILKGSAGSGKSTYLRDCTW